MAITAFALAAVNTASVHAAGTAAFSISTSGSTTVGGSYTVTVSETSAFSDYVNGVQANVSYPSAQLQYVSRDSGYFTLCGQDTLVSAGEYDMGCASTSTTGGTQTVITLHFTVIAAGSGQVKMVSGSDITSNSGASVWNGSLTSTNVSFTAPATGGGGTGNTGGGSSGGSTGGTKTTPPPSTSHTTPPPSTTYTPPPATQNPATTSPTPTVPAVTQTVPSTAALTITVTDAGGKPVKGAKVSLDSHYTTYSDAHGKAGFSDIATGSHTVVITASGKTATQQKITLTANQTKQVAVKLAGGSSAVLLALLAAAGVVIIGGAGFGYMKLSGHGFGGGKGPKLPVHGMVVGSDTAPAVHINPSTPAAPAAVSSPSPTTPTVVVQPSTPPSSPSGGPDGGDPTPKP